MSKLLKFIVNLFLILAILIAVAILVPPLAGVTTTIVDTPAMNTNLPLGSITYSTDINVYDIKPGDEILKENDSSTYAYVIKQTDPANGKFTAVSAADTNGVEEEIILRNTVSKVAVVVPLIGYIIMAMHSIEGIVIIVLVVVLMIIMFILSELWRHTPEEEEEETPQAEEEEPAQVSASEETGIDTAAIKEAVEENHAAVKNEDAAREAAAQEKELPPQDPYAGMSWSERRAAKKAKKHAEQAAASMDHAEEDPTALGAAAGAALTEAAAALSQTPNEWDSAAVDVDSIADTETADEVLSESAKELYASLSGEKDLEEESSYKNDIINDIKDYTKSDFDSDSFFRESLGNEEGKTLADLASEMKDRAEANGTDSSAAVKEPEIRVPSPFEAIEDVDEKELAAAEAEFFGVPVEEKPGPPAPSEPEEELQRFAPVQRPMYDEIVGQAKESGKDPVIRKDDRSGVSFVDVSDIL